MILFSKLFSCTEDTACGVVFVLIAPVVAIVGTLFVFMVLEVILKKPQDLTPKINPVNEIVEGIFSTLAILLASGAGIAIWNILTKFKFLDSDIMFLIAPFVTLVSIILIFAILRKVFRKARITIQNSM